MSRRRVLIATGSRAEFGLLEPVMRAVQGRTDLELQVVAAGSHLLKPVETVLLVRAQFQVDATVPMQEDGRTGRIADAIAVGRGITGFAQAFERLAPDWVVVLGDRIEAFSAASAASIGGIPVAHLHGGDRAEGIADEAMRHAITKLAHLHLAATPGSADRIVRMGERPESVRLVGSPAADGLAELPAMGDVEASALGDPEVVVLLHPSGMSDAEERSAAGALVEAIAGRVLCLAPNHDAGREAVMAGLGFGASRPRTGWRFLEHMPRRAFVGLLKRLAQRGGVLVGNSSAGLIEAAVVGLPVVNVGARQEGRERGANVIDVRAGTADEIRAAISRAAGMARPLTMGHPYGDGRAGERCAAELGATDGRALLRKRNSY